MKKYIEYSANIYAIYLKYFAKEDIHVYSIDEAFMDATNYLKMYNMTAVELAQTIIKDIFNTYGITATAGIGTNMYLTKIALDITAKHSSANIGYLDEEKYKNFFPWRIPSKWTAIASDSYYGETVNSAYYKQKGSGNNSVEWEASLPHDGYYEVSVWNPKNNINFMRRGHRRREERNQTYLLQDDQVKETITIDLEQEDEGWVPLGNFYLPRGKATITLTDKVSGDYVIADAVKFTFVE